MSVNWHWRMRLRSVGRVLRSDSSRTRTEALLAFALYQSLALLFFGLPLFRDPGGSYLGTLSNDPGTYMWFLRWWPYALAHHLNPFVTKLVWAPIGYNLTWTNSIPAPALLASPLTHVFGPVMTWNILCLIAIALDAWCAFLLCRHLCKSFLPALAGGYIFGFSPYILGQLLGHLSLTLVFPIPLAVYLVILRFQRLISAPRFTILFALTVLFQFLCRNEIVASATALGAILILLALKIAIPESRRRLLAVCILIACAFAIDAVLLAPFLYYAVWIGFPHRPFLSSYTFSADLLGFLIPTQVLLAGRTSLTTSIANRFSAGFCEGNASLGLPFILVIIDFARKSRGNPACKLALAGSLVAAVASLGPRLSVAGLPALLPLPWVIFIYLPLINQALPARFTMYLFLAAAIITSTWLASPTHRGRRWMLVALGLASIAPNLPSSLWITRLDTPAFFTGGAYRRYLAGDETVLILPYGGEGNSTFWQAATGMYFRMAGGYVSAAVPSEFSRWPLLTTLYGGAPVPDFDEELKAFIEAHSIRAIIVAGDSRDRWARLLAPLGLQPTEVGGVMLYRVPPGAFSAHSASVQQFARKAAIMTFSRIVIASSQYLAAGIPPAQPEPQEARRLDLLLDLPPRPNDQPWWYRLWIPLAGASPVTIGITGRYDDLQPLLECYAPDARQVLFPGSRVFRAGALPAEYGRLSMTFSEAGLARAALKAATILRHPDNPDCASPPPNHTLH